jgi:hypothetical protein
LSDRALLARLAANAQKLDRAADLYDERLALIRAARARPVPVSYAEIAAAAQCSEAAIFKATREAKRREGNGQ